MDYLGHIINGDGVAMQSGKIQVFVGWLTPRNVKDVQGFLGLIGYYCKFIQGYDNMAKPLTELTKKYNFKSNGHSTCP